MKGVMAGAAGLAVAAFLVCCPLARAQSGQAEQGPGVTFEQRKAGFLARIDQRVARLQEVRACVSAATTPAALRACRGAAGQDRQGTAK